MLSFINLQVSICEAVISKIRFGENREYWRGKLVAFRQVQTLMEHEGYGLKNALEARH